MQYQSFPGTKGGSRSLQKLEALRLPSLKDKRFLDIGCNEGFFCGYAQFDGASQVVGIDQSEAAIEKAKQRFTAVDFRNQSWDELPKGSFDVIIMLSALHYATDQEAMIHKMMNKLNDDGVLVLEISIAPGAANEFIKVKRSIDERFFPTRTKLTSVLKDYAWKIVGHSVNQAGDPLQRYVVHIKPLKPYAFLFIQKPGSGKSTISRKLLAGSKIPLMSGDHLYQQIANKTQPVSEMLQQAVSEGFSTATIDKTTTKVFEMGLIKEVVDLWIECAGGFNDFAIDSYIPLPFQQELKDVLVAKGFFPVEMTWDQEGGLAPTGLTSRKVKQYDRFLKKSQKKYQNKTVIRFKKLLLKEMQQKIKWHLDSPVNGEWFVGDSPVKIAGWLVGLEEYCTEFSIYIDYMGGGEVVAPNRVRLDVVTAYRDKLNDKEQAYWNKTNSGFQISITADSILRGIELGVIFQGNKMPLAQISVKKPVNTVQTLLNRINGFSRKL